MSHHTPTPAVTATVKGRRADSTRRRERVLKVLADTVAAGEEISVSGIARRAGVDHTFLYRHRDLLAHVHAAEAQPRNTGDAGPTVTRASLQADLLAAQQRCARMAARTSSSRHDYPNYSANKPGAPPGSVHRPTSTSCNGGSPSSNSRSSTCACNSRHATKNSRPHAAPTASS